jgi:NADPH-dependent 2,4-dienoyl-CoA reductase/sulfur reductase-like enzyme
MAPATAWLVGSGLEPDGVRTSASGRTRVPNVFAAGDAARPWDPAARRHRRTEHWEAAVAQAGAVARAILWLPPTPAPMPVFWSDQYGVRIHFAGSAEGHDHVEVDGDPRAREFRALMLRRGRPIGGLLVGRPRALPELRRVLQAVTPTGGLERNAA